MRVEKKTLGELLVFMTTGSRGWATYYQETGDLFLRIQNVGRNELLLNDVAYVCAPDSVEARRTKVEPNDVLLSVTADLGRTAVVPEGLGTAYINQHLALLRVCDVDPLYLSAFIASPDGRRQIDRRNRHGVKAGLNFEDVRSLEIPLLPLSEQKRIAEILDRAEALRAKRRAALALLDELTQSIFLDMFGDPVRNPKGWPIKSLEEVGVKTKTGPFGSLLHKSDYIQSGVPLVNPKHMHAGRIEHHGDETVAESKAEKLYEYRVQTGDLLMARRGEMGRCAIVNEMHDGWLCGTGSFFIRAPTNIYLAEFLESTLSSQPMRRCANILKICPVVQLCQASADRRLSRCDYLCRQLPFSKPS